MDEKSVSIGPLISENGVSHFSNIKNMATYSNAVAGLNGDYFAKRPNTSNRGQSIGFLGSNGEILVSSSDENASSDTMSSFILSKNNSVLYTYLTDTVTIHCPKNDNTFIACDINKYVPYNSIGVYTKYWSNLSIGNSEGNELVEVVVVDNKVKEIRKYLEPTAIPDDGYVLSAYGPDAIEYILNNFEVGDKIKYTVDINLDLDKMQFGISGGTILVENGEIPTFSHIVWGNNEMSAIGTNKREDKVYLIACTAKNGNTVGITQKDFAQILADYNIYNAMCLDGGGSTTMVAKELGESNISTILSEQSYLRAVPNGIGVFTSKQPTGKIGGLLIDLSDEYIFRGNYTTFDISGYDTNYYAMDIDMDKLDISFSNDNASYENGKIIGLKEGTVKVTFKYMSKKVSKELEILGEVYNLKLSPKVSNISIKDNVEFSLTATDKNGFSDSIDNSNVTWNIEQGSGTIENGKYIPETHETVIISASIDNVKVFATINVNKEKTEIFDNFEDIQGTFSAYPQDISLGEIEPNRTRKKDGRFSLKLTYDFTNTENAIRGAYYDYTTPLKMPNNISEIGIWIYSSKKNDNSIKSQYISSNGTTYIDVLVDKIDWTGWKYVTYPSFSKVREIVSIYVAQANQEISNKGYICLDNLTVTYLGNDSKNISAPSDIVPKDMYEHNLANSYCITLIDRIKTPVILFDNLLNTRLLSSINKDSDIVFTYEKIPTDIEKQIETDHEIISGYSVTDTRGLRIITIDNSKNGIRLTDYTQWENLIEDIDTNKNILIILTKSLNSFTDKLEKELLLNILKEKNIKKGNSSWIIQYGNNTNVENVNGIKIFTIGKLTTHKNMEDIFNNYRYINIYATSKDISFEIKEIF